MRRSHGREQGLPALASLSGDRRTTAAAKQTGKGQQTWRGHHAPRAHPHRTWESCQILESQHGSVNCAQLIFGLISQIPHAKTRKKLTKPSNNQEIPEG